MDRHLLSLALITVSIHCCEANRMMRFQRLFTRILLRQKHPKLEY